MVWSAWLVRSDWRERRLPNGLTLGAAAVAFAWRIGYGGWPLFLDGFAAAGVAGAFLLLPFLLRGAGAGDVKMLFAAGAIAGWERLLPMLAVMSVLGIVLTVAMLAAGLVDGARLRHWARSLWDWRYDRAAGAAALPPRDNERVRVPFSLPVAGGLLVVLTLGA